MRRKVPEFIKFNFPLKLVSVILACVLWIVVFGSRRVEITKEIKLEVVTADGIISASDLPEKITFRLLGPKAFLRSILDRQDPPIKVNLSRAGAGVVTYRFFSDNIQIPIGVKVLSINPPAIYVKLEEVETRKVPVRLEITGNPPEGYQIVTSELRPTIVEIKGAKSRVAKVVEMTMVPMDVSDMKHSVDKMPQLELERYGVALVGETPKVHFEVEPVSANFRIRNVGVRVLSRHRATLIDKTVTVLVRANPEDLDSLDQTKIYAEVDLNEMPKGKYEGKVQVVLPAHIGLVKVVPERIAVILY